MEEPVAGGAEVRREFLDADAIAALPLLSIVIQRHRFRIVIRHRPRLEATAYVRDYRIGCAIGKLGFETPAGSYTVLGKESPPSYLAPTDKNGELEPWAAEAGFKKGESLPPGHPANPLRGAFLWLNDKGIGIHGTDNPFSIGSKASHGCVRVYEHEALRLFELVPLGTPVTIV